MNFLAYMYYHPTNYCCLLLKYQMQLLTRRCGRLICCLNVFCIWALIYKWRPQKRPCNVTLQHILFSSSINVILNQTAPLKGLKLKPTTFWLHVKRWLHAISIRYILFIAIGYKNQYATTWSTWRYIQVAVNTFEFFRAKTSEYQISSK